MGNLYSTNGTLVDNIKQQGVLPVSKFSVIQLELYSNEGDILFHGGKINKNKIKTLTDIVHLDFQSTTF